MRVIFKTYLLVLGHFLLCPDSVAGIPWMQGEQTDMRKRKIHLTCSGNRIRSKDYMRHCSNISIHVQKEIKPKELIRWEMNFAFEAMHLPTPFVH